LSENYLRKLSVKVKIKSTIDREPAEGCCCMVECKAVSFPEIQVRFWDTPQSIKYRLGMELRSRPGISRSQMKPRATSEGRKEVGANRINQADNVNKMASVNSPSSAAGIARGGKSPSRILPAEGGQFRAVGPLPCSESAGGAGTSPEGDPPRRRGQTRGSGDAGGRATPGREPQLVATKSGKHLHHPDEGRLEFTPMRCPQSS